ncbi:MAG TPA: adenosine kinase [Acidimicrobiales bacterium]|nr:adenosine kinase [Acidimicrobiales bacterium]
MTENSHLPDADLDVVGIGNAIVDVISPVEEAFLAEHGLVKGAMGLIDADRAEVLYAAMPPAEESSGGSVANTIAGVASFGGTGGFVGKVRDDQLGEIFRHDIRSLGIVFEGTPAADGPSTARCLIVVTPDAERTLSTFLGTAGLLGPDDVDEALVARGKVVLAEGYLWDVPSAKDAIVKAMDHARAAGHRVALSLSDSFCVDRYRDEFLALVQERVDVLFANEAEITSLYEVDSWEAARDLVRGHCDIACLTRSEKGSVIVTADEEHVIPIHPHGDVVDTTGAGDLYAAGFLHGLTTGQDLERCGRLAALAAGEVISHYGARPETSLAELAASL